MPVKERRTKILLLVFLVSDVRFDFTQITPELQKVFDVSLNPKTKGTISSMIKEGLVEKKAVEVGQDKAPAEYKITREGFLKLCLEFPYFRFLHDEWDGLWRVISYEIPEKKRKIRDRLRRDMRGWGLGPWHRSFWITPHPIISNLNELVYGKEEEEYVQAFEATHVFGKREILVEKVWAVSKLDAQYRALFKTWHSILAAERPSTEKFKEVVSLLVKILRTDPGLPSSLLSRGWIGFEAFQIFKEVRGILMHK